MRKPTKKLWLSVLGIMLLLVMWFIKGNDKPTYSDSVMNVPAFSGDPFVVINNNQPEFSENDRSAEVYEFYSELDSLGRCGYAMACIDKQLMPTEDRESISSVKPSGWVQAQYDSVDGENLYNRCHLIGFQLTGENANERNLITGTRYMNVEGMLPFENMVADYIKETNMRVLYRVTPVFDGDNLVARGVQLEALSVEDGGEGICFNVYVYNNQPGIVIDYATGQSQSESNVQNRETSGIETTYILNTNSKKFHTASCKQAQNVVENNRETYQGQRETLLKDGYVAAGCCNP